MSTSTQSAESRFRVVENTRRVNVNSLIGWRRVGLYATLLLVGLLVGAVPMWLRARENARQRDLAQRELRLSEIKNEFSSAVIDARRGEYETARQSTSDFFTNLRNQLNAREEPLFTATQREKLTPLLSQRDDVITLLARSDPAAAELLSNLYVEYRKAMNEVPPEPVAGKN